MSPEIETKNGLRTALSILSFLALLLTLSIAASSFAGGILFSDYSETLGQDPSSLFSLGWLSIFLSVLHLLAFLSAVKTIPKKPAKGNLFKITSFAFILWAVVVALTFFPFWETNLEFLQPILTPFGVAVPIWWVFEFGKRNIPTLSKRKSLGTLSIGSSYTMAMIIMVELILFAIVLAVALVIAFSNPRVQQWVRWLEIPQGIAEISPLYIERFIRALLHNPIFIISALFFMGIIIPLIEESFKPMVLWFFRKQSISPSDGFLIGMLSGAAFTLLESAGIVLQQASAGWGQSILLRASTSLVHITCSGLVGYGYALSQQPEKGEGIFKRLFAAVALHGMWNMLALIAGFSPILELYKIASQSVAGIMIVATGLLFIELIGLIYLLWRLNRKFTKDLQQNLNGGKGVLLDEVE